MLACAGLAQPNMGQVQTPTCPPPPVLVEILPGVLQVCSQSDQTWPLESCCLVDPAPICTKKSAHNMCSSVPVGKCCRSAPGVLQE